MRTNFLDLEQVEIVCSPEFGEEVEFVQSFEQFRVIQKLKAVGATVVVRTG
jgi:hypothetical protein